MSVSISTHIVCIFFFVKGKSVGENIIVAMIWTAVVEDTLGRYPLPEVEQINLSLPPQKYFSLPPFWSGSGHDQRTHAIAVETLRLVKVDDVEDDALVGADVAHSEIEPHAKPIGTAKAPK